MLWKNIVRLVLTELDITLMIGCFLFWCCFIILFCYLITKYKHHINKISVFALIIILMTSVYVIPLIEEFNSHTTLINPNKIQHDIAVMSFNLRGEGLDTDHKHWDHRKNNVVLSLSETRPDIIGTQEG